MALNTIQQIEHLLSETNNTLICLPCEPEIDDVLAGISLARSIEYNGKPSVIVSEDFTMPSCLGFLNLDSDTVRNSLPSIRRMTISLDVSRAPLGTLKYKVLKNKKLEILLTPSSGSYSKNEVSIDDTKSSFGLVITIGAPDMMSLGRCYLRERDFFDSTPIINIDHKPENERFGSVNVIDTTAKSNCEIAYDVIEKMKTPITDIRQTPQLLLAGILSKTSGITKTHTSQRLIDTVKSLMEKGADIAEINSHLFNTHTLSQFKLWGRVLARLQEDRELGMVWSAIPYEDFSSTNTSDADLPQIIRDIISGYRNAKVILLIWQNKDYSISGIISTNNSLSAMELVSGLKPRGRRDFARFDLSHRHLREAVDNVIETVRTRIAKM